MTTTPSVWDDLDAFSDQNVYAERAVARGRDLERFVREWGERFGFLAEPAHDRHSFESIEVVANKLYDASRDLERRLTEAEHTIDAALSPFQEPTP